MNICSLGLLVGLMLGLSESPVLASAIAAAGSIVAACASVFLEAKYGIRLPRPGQEGEEAAPDPEGNPTARGEPSRPPQPLEWRGQFTAWIEPFSWAMIFGLLGGITIRTNDLLNFQSRNFRIVLQEKGFNETQVDYMMMSLALEPGEIVVQSEKKEPGNSSLLHKEQIEKFDLTKFQKQYPDPEERIKIYLQLAPSDEFRKNLNEAIKSGANPTQKVQIAEQYLKDHFKEEKS